MLPSPKFLFFLLIFIFASFHCLSHCSGISSEICHETEKQALLSFKLSLNDPDGLISSWKPQVDCCMWEHIVCSNLTGHVLELHLQNPSGWPSGLSPGLKGRLDDSLLNLTHLRYLNLSTNHFGGTIPAFIGSFPNLEYLDLSYAGFSGTLDDSLLNLTQLRYLDLSMNRFEGRIPTFFGSFPNLEYLDLSDNEFTGTIPHSIGNLSSLRTLNVGYNLLDADSVEWLSGLSNLEHLDMRWVNLSKAVDWLPVVNTLPSLAELRLWDTFLPYSFLPLNEVNFSSLTFLDLSYNYFEVFPSWILQIKELTHLELSFTQYSSIIPSSTIPHTIGNLSSLRTLKLEGGYDADSLEGLSGLDADSLEWLSGLSNLEHLDLSMVNLSKAVDWLKVVNTLPSLAELRLWDNALPYSFLPLNEVNFSSLTFLVLSYNDFEVFPSWILQIKELTHLILFDNHYSSIIPSSTSNLTKLQYLDLSDSPYFTSIPDWILGCKSLEHFYMPFSSLRGSVPRAIGNLTSLNFLDLSYNDLSGEIPSEISKLCNIRSIDLSDNKLQGEISHPFRNTSSCFLESLEVLDLGGNQVGGHLTDEFLEFRNLRILKLGNNSLSGSIPSGIGKLVSLVELGLEDNNLSGKIPESIGKLVFLEELRLHDNNLSGKIPESIGGQLYNLRYLSLSDNKLEGVVGENHFTNLTNLDSFLASRNNNLTLEVGTNWIPTFRVSELELQSWNLGAYSKIPKWLNVQRNHLENLDLSNTGIAFQFASWFWEIPTLNLSHNQLHGEIPDITSPSIYGSFHIYLSNNLFNGSLPRIRRAVDVLDLSNNLFSRGLHHFLCDESQDYFYLTILHLGKNLLSGEIPDCWKRWTFLLLLNLGNNNLSGHIPDSIGLIRGLWSLDLYNNKLSGRIPSSLQNCSVLSKIDLAYNNLVGNLPTQLGLHLPNLGILILRSNKLSGQISPNICGFISLQIIDFSDNMFSGPIPSCVDKFIPMASNQWFLDDPGREHKYFYWTHGGYYIETADVATKGNKFQYDTILSYVTSFDLSNNNLSGEIPQQLTRLVELRSLNLSGNHLEGTIPHGIGDMKELESLDLSRNSLSGEIPDTLAVLTALNHVNLSYNNLTGRIPQSTQIMGLPPSGFVGNKLCGNPLANNCNNDGGTTPGQGEEEHDGDDESEVDKWLYIFSGLGYAVGIAAVWNVFIFKKSWKDAFFGSVDNVWNKVCVYVSIKISRRR